MEVPSLTVAQRERVVLLGESGSGKSTLLSLICGILTPQRGEIAVAGTILSAMRGSARDRFRADQIGVIFQQFNLLPFATPLDNILLPLRFSRSRRRKVADPAAEALRLTEALGLPDPLITGARAADLSVGQQQRVAVARALIGQPSLIVADEPTSALDAAAQTAFLDLLFGQVAEAGSSLIMVTHDARLADRFDRVLDLSDVARVSREAAA
ncbi:ABC transporter ATP-binding protein [Rhodobacteraceae bacterium NNCM2]|nr:ABC transporter ATP-binding protein [Coraliihabitans acroporae]